MRRPELSSTSLCGDQDTLALSALFHWNKKQLKLHTSTVELRRNRHVHLMGANRCTLGVDHLTSINLVPALSRVMRRMKLLNGGAEPREGMAARFRGLAAT
ncbi:hypothetical protein PROFUN_02110 [Planoprotostelium fungivorum]|uniref:Uncharacterized protein n=1 Tax=Planoprotostelium fungivorum TaxID=1890364 RepID=A0A2P6NZ50_9EUKA|nr:hypothetical protein PROFUN_02110 [Planoprotostelium fungivorum]